MKVAPPKIIIIVAAATIGSGVFALPYIIQESGWLLSLGYFIAIIAIVSLAHILYLRTLETVDEQERLLGLARKYFGDIGFWAGFLAIVIGLLLSFVAYLVLGSQFIKIIISGIPPPLALIIFWLIIVILVFKSEGKVTGFEVTGVSLIFCATLFIFISGNPLRAFSNVSLVNPGNIFLPFGAVLFSLAGWTSVEQVYEIRKKAGGKTANFTLFVLGAILAGVLYWLFALGVLGTVSHTTIDTISGVAGWPFWKKDILATIGLVAMGVVSIPLAREIRGALEKDLRWNSTVSRLAIVGLPLIVVLFGFNNFLIIVGLAGGVFISAQYLLIIAVSRRTLQFSSREKILLDVLTAIFVCAAIYEIATFIVK
jgi:tyrosine-specific transport protein